MKPHFAHFRRLSSIEFADQSICQVLDQTGHTLFTKDFAPAEGGVSPQAQSLIQQIRKNKTGGGREDRRPS